MDCNVAAWFDMDISLVLNLGLETYWSVFLKSICGELRNAGLLGDGSGDGEIE